MVATAASNRSIGLGHQLEPKLAVIWPSSGGEMIELRTLGTLSLLGLDSSELQTVLVQPKRVALLTYLAVVSRMGLVRRDPLLGLFWPEHDEARARASLRQALYEFRQELGQEVLVTRGDDEVGLNWDVFWCDVSAFEAALAASDLELAVSLYRGSFLAGFSLRGSVEFDQWLEVERDRLARAYAGALEQLAEAATGTGQAQQAAEWWRRLVEHDPYATRGVLRLMEALESAGDRAGALEQADRHAVRMLAELDAEPSPDVVALAERLRRQPVAHDKTQVQLTEGQQTADPVDRLRVALASRYTIERELGSGGMATVYLAADVKHDRKVAVKVLRPELAATLGAERFLREIQIAAKLAHPHILPLYDSGKAGDFLYYVMPYVAGESLRDRLSRDRQLPIEDALRLTCEVADALGSAHRHNVIHRDIKPENILIEEGHAVVADFGVARAISAAGGTELTETGIAVGTPAYMSPEQASGEVELDGRSDIYSLGCVLYEMLGGEPPYTGPTPQAVIAKKLSEPTPRISVVREAVPQAVETALDKALAKTPVDRFDTPAGLVAALNAALLGISAPTAAQRWKVPVALLSVVAVAVALSAVAVAVLRPGVATSGLDPDHVVVAPLRNATGDPSLDQLGERASHWITQGVQQAAIPVTPWDAALQQWEYVQTEVEASRVRDPIMALAEETGAGTVVSGAVYLEGDSLEIQVNVTDATRGRLLGTVEPIRGSRESVTEVITEARQRVMAFLAFTFEPKDYLTPVAELQGAPPTFDAYQAYREGLNLQGQIKSQGPSPIRDEAILHMRHAAELAPSWAAPLDWLYLLLSNGFRRAEADSVLRVLESLGDKLTPYEQASARAWRAELEQDPEQKLRALRRKAELNPGGTGNLAFALYMQNRPHEALEEFRKLRLERSGSGVSWWGFTDVLHMLGEHEQELEAARRAYELHPDGGAYILRLQARALAALGQVDELNEVLDEIEAASDLTWVHRALRNTVDALGAYGHADAAQQVAERVAGWFERRPPEEAATLTHRVLYGRALFSAGRTGEAQDVLDAVVAEFPENFWGRGVRAFIAASRGDTAQAMSDIAWFSADERLAISQWQRGTIAGALGDRQLAVSLIREAIEKPTYQFGADQLLHMEYHPLRDYPPFQELLRPKG